MGCCWDLCKKYGSIFHLNDQWPQASSGAIYHQRWGSRWQVQPSFITNKNRLQISSKEVVLCFDFITECIHWGDIYIWFLFIEIVSIRIDPNYRVAWGTLYWGSEYPWSPQNEATGHSFTTQLHYLLWIPFSITTLLATPSLYHVMNVGWVRRGSVARRAVCCK